MSVPSEQFSTGRWVGSQDETGTASPAGSFVSTDETDAAFALAALASAAASMPQISSPPDKTIGMALANTTAVTPSPPTIPTPTSSHHRGNEARHVHAKVAAPAQKSPTSGAKRTAKKKSTTPKTKVGTPKSAKSAVAKQPKAEKAGKRKAGDPMPLSLPSDAQHLSSSACILRQQIEVFAATLEDTMERGARHRPPVGAVGIRCIHCLHLPYKERARGAVTFPSCIRLMYQGVRNFQRYHVPLCTYIPEETKKNLNKANASTGNKLSRHGTTEYWENSSRGQLGLVDVKTEKGDAVFFRDFKHSD